MPRSTIRTTTIILAAAALSPLLTTASPHYLPPQANLAAAWPQIATEVFAPSPLAPARDSSFATSTHPATATATTSSNSLSTHATARPNSESDAHKVDTDMFILSDRLVRRAQGVLPVPADLSWIFTATTTSASTTTPHHKATSTPASQPVYPTAPPDSTKTRPI